MIDSEKGRIRITHRSQKEELSQDRRAVDVFIGKEARSNRADTMRLQR